MKSIIAISVVVFILGGYMVSLVVKNDVDQIIKDTAKTKNEPAEGYKRVGDDKDSVVESTNLLVEKIKSLSEQVDKLEKAANNSNQTTSFQIQPIAPTVSNPQQKVGQLIAKGEDVVHDLLDKTGVIDYQINNTNARLGEVSHLSGDSNYIWHDSISSLAPISEQPQQDSKADQRKTEVELEAEVLPKFTIPENAIFSTVNTSALLGRIPADGQVQDPFRFSLKIKDVGLFANYHKNDRLDGVILSGTASGDLLLSCVRATVDSVTYIFTDGTISQNNGADLATITDKYGYPCIKGELVTNAPQNIAVSSLLAGLSSAASAIANAERTISTDASGNTTSQVTGNAGTFGAYSALSGAVSNTHQWINERAKSSFDVIVSPAGQNIQLFFNKQVAIDYDPNGRKLIHQNNVSEVVNAEFD